jgi:hypothetical protein
MLTSIVVPLPTMRSLGPSTAALCSGTPVPLLTPPIQSTLVLADPVFITIYSNSKYTNAYIIVCVLAPRQCGVVALK